jgi:O-antigen/teichoic acid export membrane protein
VMLAISTLLAQRMLAGLTTAREPLGDIRREATSFALSSSVMVVLGALVLQRSELFFLAWLSSDAQIALYSIAFSATLMLAAVPSAAQHVVLPSVARLRAAGEDNRIGSGFGLFTRLSLLFALPAMAAAAAIGPELLTKVYGNEYSGAAEVLLVLLVPFPLIPLVGGSSALLLGFARARVVSTAYGAAAIADLVVCLALIPTFGANGAAVANGVAVSMLSLLLLAATRRAIGPIRISLRNSISLAVGSLAAGAVARGVLSIESSWLGLVAAGLAFSLVLVAISALLRVISSDDADWLGSAPRSRRSRHLAQTLVGPFARPTGR